MAKIKVYVVPPHSRSTSLRLRWKMGQKWREKSAKTISPKEAAKQAAQLEADLNAGRVLATERISWSDFCLRYEREHLSGLAKKTAALWRTAKNQVDNLVGWKWLEEATPDAISSFRGLLSDSEVTESTIAAYLRQLRAAINWGHTVGLLPLPVKIAMPKRIGKNTKMRGRPVTEKELALMLAAVPKIRPHDAPAWKHLLEALYLSGLRLSESQLLSWEDDTPLTVDLSGKHPRFRIWSEGEKGRKDRYLPMTPDFAEWLLKTPKKQRKGLVFRLPPTMSMEKISAAISDIGEKAGVVVNSATGKFASAHDLRRSFGTRWAARVKPAVLQLLMRHEEISTTMKFYVAQDADDVAAELWEEFG